MKPVVGGSVPAGSTRSRGSAGPSTWLRSEGRVGVGRSGGKTKKVARSRPRIRTHSRLGEALPRDRHGSRVVASAVPAASPRLSLREDREGEGEIPCPALDPIELGGFPPEAFRDVRRYDPVGNRPRDAARGFPVPSSRGKTKANPEREGAAGGVPRVHRSRAGDDPAVLSEARGGDRGDSCAICGVLTDLTIDHILPRSLGGPDTPTNRRHLCRRCNSVKGGRIVSDDALHFYRSFQHLSRRMGLGLEPPPLGCVGPAPILNRLMQFARAREGEAAQ
jgi:HNH endonuclease